MVDGFSRRSVGYVGASGVHAQQDGHGVLKQSGSCLRRLDWPSPEQGDLQVILQGRDLLRHRSLGVSQLFGSRGEGAEPGHGHERPEQVRVHATQGTPVISVAYGSTSNDRLCLTLPDLTMDA